MFSWVRDRNDFNGFIFCQRLRVIENHVLIFFSISQHKNSFIKLYVNQSKKKSIVFISNKAKNCICLRKKLCMRLGSVLFLLFAYDQKPFTCCIILEYLMYKLSCCIYTLINVLDIITIIHHSD